MTDIKKIIDFIIKYQTGWKCRRGSEEWIARYNSLIKKSHEEIIKIYKEC